MAKEFFNVLFLTIITSIILLATEDDSIAVEIRHPNVKLFISHGGLMGTQESIYCGVPRLGIPFFADQELNLRASEEMGVAIMVKYDNITKESILEATTKLLTDIKYQNNAKKISSLFRDRPSTPLETAVYWVEYVIRHKGAPHLRTVGADLPWYQYFLVDVAAVFVACLGIVLTLMYYVILFILNIFWFKNRKSKKD